MHTVLTANEIRSRYSSEWVLVGDPQTGTDLEVQAGQVLHHSPDRDEVYRKAIELKPTRFAILFTGEIPEGTAVVLCASLFILRGLILTLDFRAGAITLA